MKPPPFDYVAPSELEEVLDLLAEHGDEAKIIAGGQSLVPLLSMRLARPSVLVDINGVRSLGGIERRDGVVAVGAATRERDAERSATIHRDVPVMAQALPLIGHVSIRNRGTIGGSLAHADASAELPAVATITGAEMVIRNRHGERVVPAAEFFEGHFSTCLGDDECLVEVRIPASPPSAGWAFVEVARRHGDFALVGAAAMVALSGGTVHEARVCLIGVADRALRIPSAEALLSGASPSEETFSAAAAEAVREIEPASDVHASAAVRRHLAEVTLRRALTAAAGRAGGGA